MKILLIETELFASDAYAPQFRTWGAEVTVCSDVETAFAAYQQTVYPLIVLNLNVPTAEMATWCRRLRVLPGGTHTRILALVAPAPIDALQTILEAGADDYLLTPTDPQLLRLRFTMLTRQIAAINEHQHADTRLTQMLAELQQTEVELRMQNEELSAANAELRQMQAQLEIARQTYADLYDAAPVGYCTFDEHGTVLAANLTAATLLGVAREALINARFYQFIVAEERDRFFLHLRTLRETQRRQTCELRLQTLDGVVFYGQLDTIMAPTADAARFNCRSTISDITARRRLEEELQTYRQHLEELVAERTAELQNSHAHLAQEINGRKRAAAAVRTSEQQYRLLAENIADGLVIIQAGHMRFVNDAFSAMLACPVPQLLEREFVTLFRADYQDACLTRVAARALDMLTRDWQAVCLTADAREIWTESAYQRIEWEGQPALLATIRDINRRKLRESAMEAERAHLRQENIQLRSVIEDRAQFGELIGKTPVMQAVYAQIVTAAAVDANVLLVGESGTGKELAARTIHQLSHRKVREFVAVNCGAIPENLFEREFFGHRKGAFTGATQDTPGLFDRAHHGTLFLDEIGELSLAMQVKLLRVLESGEYLPVGDNRARQVDVRLIAATNKQLDALVRQGGMRDDFFYRIYVLSITMPPLRQHPDDIQLLIEHFLQQQAYKTGEQRPEIPTHIVKTLMQHAWPGNVRELYNVLHRYLQDQQLAFSDLSRMELEASGPTTNSGFERPGGSFRTAVEAYEQQLITAVLRQHQNNMAQAALILGIPLRTLYRKIEKYHLL